MSSNKLKKSTRRANNVRSMKKQLGIFMQYNDKLSGIAVGRFRKTKGMFCGCRTCRYYRALSRPQARRWSFRNVSALHKEAAMKEYLIGSQEIGCDEIGCDEIGREETFEWT